MFLHSVIYRVFDYLKYHYFHVYYKFPYVNRIFWKNMFTITSCLCSLFWTELFLVFHRTLRMFLTKTGK